ncbi:RNA polymerase sigma factor [Chitinophaga sp. S165]|uniref:RNA polymerase sigma factor n=1 Tax=Chitinophaga sp. S165 TaxID=2135462 RepID=UPI000D71C586|nr:RNA polymerase sigma-70 factor [Chitinophaga sp. S165]PWV47675.1 RNA polymerase sigma-70 factor (ECF subfamily) [Chitinophaga sp. S165]
MGYGQYTDEELLQGLKQSKKGAYNEIYSRYWKKMLTVALNHNEDGHIAKDIVQEVFIDLWEKRHSYEIQSLPAFLATAVKFQVFKYYRKEQRRALLAKENYVFDDLYEEEEKLHARFLKDMIDGIVEEMPEKCRLVFHYSRNLGLKNEEIAEQAGITKKTVENTLNRALRIIRGKLKNHGIPLLTIVQVLLLRK